jgi:hypothetical protein
MVSLCVSSAFALARDSLCLGDTGRLGCQAGGKIQSRLLVKQIAPFAAENARNLIDGLQSDILPAPLGPAEMRPLQLHQIASGLLGQPPGYPEAAQVQAEYREDIHA